MVLPALYSKHANMLQDRCGLPASSGAREQSCSILASHALGETPAQRVASHSACNLTTRLENTRPSHRLHAYCIMQLHAAPLGAPLGARQLLVGMPPMKVRGLGASPLNVAPEKSNPGCSFWNRSSIMRCCSCCWAMGSSWWPAIAEGHGSPCRGVGAGGPMMLVRMQAGA